MAQCMGVICHCMHLDYNPSLMQSGMFPVTHVEAIIPSRPVRFVVADAHAIAIADVSLPQSCTTDTCCMCCIGFFAIHRVHVFTPIPLTPRQFQGIEADELSFHAWDRIQLRRRVDDNWLEGMHAGSVGIFPVKFARVVVDLPSVKVAPGTPVLMLMLMLMLHVDADASW